MKCVNCGFIAFDNVPKCPKCEGDMVNVRKPGDETTGEFKRPAEWDSLIKDAITPKEPPAKVAGEGIEWPADELLPQDGEALAAAETAGPVVESAEQTTAEPPANNDAPREEIVEEHTPPDPVEDAAADPLESELAETVREVEEQENRREDDIPEEPGHGEESPEGHRDSGEGSGSGSGGRWAMKEPSDGVEQGSLFSMEEMKSHSSKEPGFLREVGTDEAMRAPAAAGQADSTSFVERAAAFAVDNLLLNLGAVILIYLSFSLLVFQEFMDLSGIAKSAVLPLYIFFVAVNMTYYTFFHGTSGQTPGKMFFKLRVLGADGEPMDIYTSFVRCCGYIVSAAFLGAGFLWVLVDKEGRAWHDRIAGTSVTRD
jgi:uncharacterized RDD family membrane protein YckC